MGYAERRTTLQKIVRDKMDSYLNEAFPKVKGELEELGRQTQTRLDARLNTVGPPDLDVSCLDMRPTLLERLRIRSRRRRMDRHKAYVWTRISDIAERYNVVLFATITSAGAEMKMRVRDVRKLNDEIWSPLASPTISKGRGKSYDKKEG